MRFNFVKFPISLIIIGSLTITSACPAFALRQTGLEESPPERERLAQALVEGNRGNFPGGVMVPAPRAGVPAPARRAGLEEKKPARLGNESEKREFLLQQAHTELWRDFGAHSLAVGTDPALFRDRLDQILAEISREFEDVEQLEGLKPPRVEQLQNMTSFLFTTYQQLSSRYVQAKTLTNAKYGTDALTAAQVDEAAGKVLDLLQIIANRFPTLTRAVIDQEWQANLLRLGLADVEKPYRSTLPNGNPNLGGSLFAQWAEKAAEKKEGKATVDSIETYAIFLRDRINESNLVEVELATGEVWGHDYGGITTRLAVLTGTNFVMMNPTLARRGVLESPQAWGRTTRHIVDYARKHPEATPPELWAQATFAAGWYSRMALYPEFLLSHGQRGQVSLQLDPRRYTREEILGDIDQFIMLLAPEAAEFLNNFVVDARVLSEGEIQATVGRPDGTDISKINTVFKVDGSNRLNYGDVLAKAIEQLEEQARAGVPLEKRTLDLVKLGRETNSIVTELHRRGIPTNYTAHFRVGFAADLTQWAGNAVARAEQIPVHGGYKTQMAGRGDEFLADAVLHFLANEKPETGSLGVLPVLIQRLRQQEGKADLVKQFEAVLAAVKKLAPTAQGIVDQIRNMKIKIGEEDLALEDAVNRLVSEGEKISLPTDDDVRMFGVTVIQTDQKARKPLAARLAAQGVTPWETGPLLASTRPWVVNGKLVHFAFTTPLWNESKRGLFPSTGYVPLSQVEKLHLRQHLQELERKRAAKDEGSFVEEVPPAVLERLRNSSVGNRVREFTQLSLQEAWLYELLIGPYLFGNGGLPVDRLDTSRFINFTFTGSYDLPKPPNAAAAAKVGGQFIGDGNRFEGEAVSVARLATYGQFGSLQNRLHHLLQPLFDFQKEKDPDLTRGNAVADYLAKKPSPTVETWLGRLSAVPEFKPLADQIAKEGLAVPVSPFAQAAAGLEERQPVSLAQLREERALLPSAPELSKTVGFVAGPHITGLALGSALLGKVTHAGAFLVESQAQASGLEELGVSRNLIIVIGSPEAPTREGGITRARNLVIGMYQVSNVVELGTKGPVDQSLQQILKNLFGIELTPESIAVWQSFVEQVLGALSQMV